MIERQDPTNGILPYFNSDMRLLSAYIFYKEFYLSGKLIQCHCGQLLKYRLYKLERTLAKADLLILDKLSYLSFNRHQSELLFNVISDRSEKRSTIVATNLPFSKWTDLFENTTMVAALIDRLKATKLSRAAQILVSGVAHFFVVLSGSKIHERLAHFFIEIYTVSLTLNAQSWVVIELFD